MKLNSSMGMAEWDGTPEERVDLARTNEDRARHHCPPIRVPDPTLAVGVTCRAYQAGTDLYRQVELLRATPGCLGAQYLPPEGRPRSFGYLPAGTCSFWPDDGRPSFVDGASSVPRWAVPGMLAGERVDLPAAQPSA